MNTRTYSSRVARLFENDQLCATCGNWYTPEALFDTTGICPFCLKKKAQAMTRAHFNTGGLDVIYSDLMADDIELDSWVYFICGRETNRVKIGFTTDLLGRFRDLQVGSPDILYILGAFRAPIKYETIFHKLFEPFHSHGEWYDLNISVKRWILKRTHYR